jgi:hypothetical protein
MWLRGIRLFNKKNNFALTLGRGTRKIYIQVVHYHGTKCTNVFESDSLNVVGLEKNILRKNYCTIK